MFKSATGSPVKNLLNKSFLLFLLLPLFLIGCSTVTITKPTTGAVFTAGQSVEFEGKISRSSETGGEDRSNELSWSSSINGNLGTGSTINTNILNVGTHGITASWPGHNRSDSISIQVNR